MAAFVTSTLAACKKAGPVFREFASKLKAQVLTPGRPPKRITDQTALAPDLGNAEALFFPPP